MCKIGNSLKKYYKNQNTGHWKLAREQYDNRLFNCRTFKDFATYYAMEFTLLHARKT